MELSKKDKDEKPPNRPKAFDKMDELVREMMNEEQGGVPVRSQKLFLTSIPAAFMGYDLIEWLILRLEIEESEALNIANQLCQYGYFFPISDSRNLVVKDDSSLYRFQTSYYWPWQHKPPDNLDYAIYLYKRTLRNRQRHGLEDYEVEAMTNLKRNLANKWEAITNQAKEQVDLLKKMKKAEKAIMDSQEKAYWRVYRPPPGIPSAMEQIPIASKTWNYVPKQKTEEDLHRDIELLNKSIHRTRLKVSQALDSVIQDVETYSEFDPLLTQVQPSNPWVTDDITYWQLNAPIVEFPTEKRVRKWGLSMEDLLSDPTGVQEFTNYLRKEKSEENILFWLAVNDLRRSAQAHIAWKIQEIYNEYVKLGSPREVNIDNQTMDKVLEGIKNNSRFCFDAAQEHVYNLLLKKDCYPRFIRSDYYKNLLASGIQPLQKKRFFNFGQTRKKATATTATNQSQSSSQGVAGALVKRRGSDRSLSGSAHEISHFGVNTSNPPIIKDSKVPHSHSQSNLSDIPYRGDLVDIGSQNVAQSASAAVGGIVVRACAATAAPANLNNSPVKKPTIVAGASTSEEVCPWDAPSPPKYSPSPRHRKNSTHVDSESSSSDLSVQGTDLAEKRVQRKVNLLTQQHTMDSGKKLHVDLFETPRRASVSVPISHSSGSGAGECSKRKVSSFEDNSSTTISAASSVFVLPNDKDNNNSKSEQDSPSSASKSLRKSHCIAKSCSISGAAPIINVSQAGDDGDTPVSRRESINLTRDEDGTTKKDTDNVDDKNNEDQSNNKESSMSVEDERKNTDNSDVSMGCLNQQEQVEKAQTSRDSSPAKAPLAEVESESPSSELPPSEVVVVTESNPEKLERDLGSSAKPSEGTIESSKSACAVAESSTKTNESIKEPKDNEETKKTEQEGEGKSNDVCPWEDEESCKVDTPFVKTYATLGYL